MHGILPTVLLAVTLAGGEVPGGLPAAVAIAPGSRTTLRLDTALTTRTARTGDPVLLRTAGPLTVRGQLIPAGSPARGRVAFAARPGRVRGRAQLAIEIDAVAARDGTWLAVDAWSPVMEPDWRPPVRRLPYEEPRVPVLAGMAAGYGVAGLVSNWSNSEEAVARSGLVAGISTIVLIETLKRGPELLLRPGTAIDFVFEADGSTPSASGRRPVTAFAETRR